MIKAAVLFKDQTFVDGEAVPMKKHELIRIFISLLTIVLAAALCMAVIHIYMDGYERRARLGQLEPIFTVGILEAHIRPILFLVIGWVRFVLLDAVLGPAGRYRPRTAKHPYADLSMVHHAIKDLTDISITEAHYRKRIMIIRHALLMIPACFMLRYLLKEHHFIGTDPEYMTGQTLVHTIPLAFICCLIVLATERMIENSMEREISALKPLMKKPADKAADEANSHHSRARTVMRALVLAGALLFIALGIANGGLNDVLVKAVSICTECIGLG